MLYGKKQQNKESILSMFYESQREKTAQTVACDTIQPFVCS